MKKVIAYLAFVVLVSTCAFTQEIPPVVEQRIRQIYAEKYPNNFSLQKTLIENQFESYRYIQRWSSEPGIPQDIFNKIKETYAKKYPDNYSLQKTLIQNQCESYRSLNGGQSSNAGKNNNQLNTTVSEIVSFSGSGGLNTRPFTTTGPWEIQWDAKGDLFQLYIFIATGNLIGVAANQQGSGKGASYQPNAGKYYLQVNAIGSWSIKIISVNENSIGDKAKEKIAKQIWKRFYTNQDSPYDYFEYDSEPKNILHGAIGQNREHTVMVMTRHMQGQEVLGMFPIGINCTKQMFYVVDLNNSQKDKSMQSFDKDSPIYFLYKKVCGLGEEE